METILKRVDFPRPAWWGFQAPPLDRHVHIHPNQFLGLISRAPALLLALIITPDKLTRIRVIEPLAETIRANPLIRNPLPIPAQTAALSPALLCLKSCQLARSIEPLSLSLVIPSPTVAARPGHVSDIDLLAQGHRYLPLQRGGELVVWGCSGGPGGTEGCSSSLPVLACPPCSPAFCPGLSPF